MRKYVILAIAALVVVVGGVIGVRSWLATRARTAEVERKVTAARELMGSDQGLSQAAVELDAALLLDPDDVPTLLARGEVAMRLKQLNDAIRHLDRAVQLSAGSELARVHLVRGDVLAERYRGSNRDDDFRAANNSYLAARSESALEAEAIEGLANLYLFEGRNQDYVKVRRFFEELLQKHPDYSRAAEIREIVDVLKKAAEKGG